jgi:hypothetical protein
MTFVANRTAAQREALAPGRSLGLVAVTPSSSPNLDTASTMAMIASTVAAPATNHMLMCFSPLATVFLPSRHRQRTDVRHHSVSDSPKGPAWWCGPGA